MPVRVRAPVPLCPPWLCVGSIDGIVPPVCVCVRARSELDNVPIETWEVADFVFDKQSAGDRERFRFQLCVTRCLGTKPVTDILELDLSHSRLQYVDRQYLRAAVKLHKLNLSYNYLGDDAVRELDLATVPLRFLNISGNAVS